MSIGAICKRIGAVWEEIEAICKWIGTIWEWIGAICERCEAICLCWERRGDGGRRPLH